MGEKRIQGVASVAARAQAGPPVARDRSSQATMNDPVIALPVEEKITPPRCRRQRNREDRVPASQVRDHARVTLCDDDDRRPVGGQHQVEGLVAQHATWLGWNNRHVEVGLVKT